MKFKQKKTKKNEKAITLIALVVTIVVLLILAGVSISMLTGENGIIKQAVEAKDKNKKAEIEEKVQLAVSAARTAGLGEVDFETLNTELKSSGYTGANITSLPATVTIDDVSVVITGDGSVAEQKWKENEDGSLTDGISTVQIGDYVNYDHSTGSVSPYTAQAAKTGADTDQTYQLSDYTGKWRVLGTDGLSLLLISEGIVGNVTLKGQPGYEFGVSELNNICSIYGYGEFAQSARSINVDDVNKLTGYNPEEAKYGEGNVDEYGNEVTYSWNGTNFPAYTSTNGKAGTLSSSHEHGFSWYDNGWNNSELSPTGTIATIKSTAYNYSIYTGTMTKVEGYFDYYTLDDATVWQNLLLDGHWCNAYWLAYPCVNAWSVDFGLFEVNGYGSLNSCSLAESDCSINSIVNGVRAVVTLKSDIQLTENGANNWTISEDV